MSLKYEPASEPLHISNPAPRRQYNPTFEQLWAPEAGPLNPYYANGTFFFSSVLLSSLELSDIKVYEPHTRANGTARPLRVAH